MKLPKRYDPAGFEAKWQRAWEEAHLFRAPDVTSHEGTYSIALPPPNVTGVLTFGHSLGGTAMDVLVRWHRMQGRPTLWLPGVDHAGLATQMAVRRHLEKQGVNVPALSREELHRHIEAWRQEKEAYIRGQLTAHGFSLDWSRYVYTMDPPYREAVRRAFLTLFREGLVYRAERMVHWDPKALTALSDLEVIPTEVRGTLWFVRYPSADPAAASRGEGIVVATTRPETLFGDVAVAVHPDDERHRAWVGKPVRLPLTDRTLPVVADPGVDPTFGNGALKITPSHDPLDREIALRHPELPSKRDTLDARAHLTGEFVPERWRGMERQKARLDVVAALREEGLLVEERPHVHHVGYSERSDVPVEPRLSTQWFADTSRLGPPALEAVRAGTTRIFPEHWTKTYYHFMENLQPWCISRQVVWGHEIPVWYCEHCPHFDAFERPPGATHPCPACGRQGWRQDPDVLDTWFSSWLWPFATLGWPGTPDDLRAYYPLSVLVTGSDIVFFWVARMMMAGLKFRGEVPFPHVFLTGILRDRQGRKLSKHLGNSPDPLELVQQWGADAFRFALVFPMPVDQGGAWEPQKSMEGARNFLTKLWNLARLLQVNLPPGETAPPAPPSGPDAPLMDRWLLSRSAQTLEEVERALGAYDLTGAATRLYTFVWHEMADWWAEAAKDRLAGKDGEPLQRSARATGRYVLDRVLRMLHPFVPHLTEELWQAFPHDGPFLAVAPWPTPSTGSRDPAAEEEVGRLQEIVTGIRVLRAEAAVGPEERPAARLRATDGVTVRLLARPEGRTLVERLAKLSAAEPLPEGEASPAGSRPLVLAGAEVYLLLDPGRAGAQAERVALQKERELVAGLLQKAEARLADPTFRAKAPPTVVAEAEGKRDELVQRLARLERHLVEAAGAGA